MNLYIWREPLMDELLVVLAASLDEARTVYHAEAQRLRTKDKAEYAAADAVRRKWSLSLTEGRYPNWHSFGDWLRETPEGREYSERRDAMRMDTPDDEADWLIEQEPVAMLPADVPAIVTYRVGGYD